MIPYFLPLLPEYMQQRNIYRDQFTKKKSLYDTLANFSNLGKELSKHSQSTI